MLYTFCAIAGSVTILGVLLRVFRFTRHFLKPSALPRYLHGEAWALVTGASDGIGAGLVGELANRGFNVVLHGRNQSKLEGYIKDLAAKHPKRQFRTAVLDAKTASAEEIKELADRMPKNLTILINNVGTGSGDKGFSRFLDRSIASVGSIVAVNEGFADMLTRALLPQLIANQPALIINVGSILDNYPCTFVEEYTGGKAHNRAFSHSLRATMAYENYDVEVMYLRVFSVATPGSGEEPSFTAVTPSLFAKGVLDRVGCTEGETFGCLRHAVMIGLAEMLVPDYKKVLGKMGASMISKKLSLTEPSKLKP